ncbi:MAG: hypothetical protein M3355_06005 [Actinomycetota bacterium]|nr:hypothetical protein [Actinomycetota bacterium]
MRKWVSRAGMRAGLGLACLGAVTSSAEASAPFTEKEAKRALRAVERVDESGAPKLEPTIALRDLALALPELDGAAEHRAKRVLSRPPDGTGEASGRWPADADEQTVETPAFIVHYALVPGCVAADENCDEPDLTDNDANGIPDYVDAAVEAVDRSIQVENGELGWPEPKGDGDDGEPQGGPEKDRVDIYLSDLCGGNNCVFGYAQVDDNSSECINPPYLCSAYLVVDNDYAEFGASGGELGLRVTTAHEYNHILQFNLDTNQDSWMFESTATWAEEQVFPDDDDWVRSYMASWVTETEIPLTKSDFKFYGSAIWNHWIENGDSTYGPDVVLDAWELSRNVTPKDDAVASYDQAIEDNGGESFFDEFVRFTSATAEWNAGVGNLPDHEKDPEGDHLPNVPREGGLTLGKEPKMVTLDNTSFELFDVNPKGADEVRFKVRADGDVRWGLSLVGRVGGRFDGTVERLQEYRGYGTRGSISLPDIDQFDRLTAIVTNADDRQDNKEFRLKIR